MHDSLLLLALAVVPLSVRAETGRIAVVVGNNDGGAGKAELRYSERDAERVAEVFRTLGNVANVRLLLGRDAAELGETLRAVTEAAAASGEPPVVLFFYSGHADDRALLLGETRFEFAELRRRLQALPARVTIAFVDACQSGRLTRTKGGRVVPVVDVRFEDNRAYAGHVFVTSSAVGETSQEADEIEASYFTHYLLSGLRGAADVSGDRLVSLDEAYQYVYRNTLLRTSASLAGVQHPTYDLDVTGRGELILTALGAGTSGLVLPEAASGSFLVRATPAGTIVAEVDKARGQTVRLALSPGSYEVARVAGDRIHEKRVALAAGTEVTLDERDMTSRRRAQALAKGGSVHELVIAYALRTGHLRDAGWAHGARLGYAADLGVLRVGLGLAWGHSSYRRDDAVQVRLDEIDLGATAERRLVLRRPLFLSLGLATGVAWIEQAGTLPGGDSQRLHSPAFFYQARAGLAVVAGAWLAGAWGTFGQRVRATQDGLGSPAVVGFDAGVGYSF